MKNHAAILHGEEGDLIDSCHLPDSLGERYGIHEVFAVHKRMILASVRIDALYFVPHSSPYLMPNASRMALLVRGLILPPLSALMTVVSPNLAFLASSA